MIRTQKKDQYALRALVELAKFAGQGPRKISDIARAQAIPIRFLEVILHNLKGSGLVTSKRGVYGGYQLQRGPDQITVGEVFRHMQGVPDPDQCLACLSKNTCPFQGKCAYMSLWHEVQSAIYKVYDQTSIADLLKKERYVRRDDPAYIYPEKSKDGSADK